MEDLEFRKAGEEDVPLILYYIRKLAEYEGLADEVVATEESLTHWLFERKGAEVIFPMKNGKEIGFALYFHNFSTFLGRSGIYIEDLYIEPEHRGRGYGTALIRKIASVAAEEGCGRVEWWCLDSNGPSVEYYLSLGAERMGKWTVYRLEGKMLERMAQGSTMTERG